jgi:hypothetical protein
MVAFLARKEHSFCIQHSVRDADRAGLLPLPIRRSTD